VSDENLVAIIDAPADGAPDRVALALEDRSRCTYGELADEVARWAATLAAAGVGAGDAVALVDWGGVRSICVTLAAAHLGAITTQMNPRLTTRELGQLLEVSSSGRVAVAGDDGAANLAAALGTDGVVLDQADPDATTVPPRAAGGDAPAVVLFTSGTTGVPKAVPISHRAALERIRAYRPPFDATRPVNVTLMGAPSFHVGGMLGLLVSLYGGDTTVVLPRFDAGRWLALVAEHRVVSAFVVPTMLARILDHPDLATTDTSSLRLLSYGAAAAPTELVRRALEHWPDAGFANTFGQTETIGAYTSLSPSDHRDPRRIGSVGRPLPGVEVRVVDPSTGQPVGPDVVGEIWVRSSQVAPASGTALDDGWLRTGDVAHLDADGYLFPHGRMSDTINRGGEKFEPSEVAERLRTHPAVLDVVVAGIPDDELGQRVGAAIVVRADEPTPTPNALRDWCRGDLAAFKLPDVVVMVDALPYNELGKLPRSVAIDLITGAPRT
jgi:acyl-CoA synthetase (AMP-forming)/AMP-acid ligase II